MPPARALSTGSHKLLKAFEEAAVESSPMSIDVYDRLVGSLLKSDWPFDESICSKEIATTVWSVLIDAGRKGLTVKEFSDELNFLRKTATLGPLIETYKKHGDALREVMQTIGWEYPKVVGINWSILSVVESNDDKAEIEEPLAEISLETLATGETEASTFNVVCNKNQLLDLAWKVKEAENFLRNVANCAENSTTGAKQKRQ